MKFSIKDFFCKLEQIRRKLHISPNLLKKSLTESFIFVQRKLFTPSVQSQKLVHPGISLNNKQSQISLCLKTHSFLLQQIHLNKVLNMVQKNSTIT